MITRPMAALIFAALAIAPVGASGGAALAADCAGGYAVQPGDTLEAVAESCGISVEALLRVNPEIADPGRISVGLELTIPDGDVAEDRVRERDESAAPVPAAGRYTVEPGDSMARIASRLGLPLPALLAANENVDPRTLQPGQELALPSDVPAAADGEETDPSGEPAGDAGERTSGGSAENTVAAAPAPEEITEPEPQRMVLEGRIRKGGECPVLRTPDGLIFSLVSQTYGFTPGDYVAIEGEPVEMSFCMEGQTVRVTRMQPKPAPRGG